MGNQMAWRRKSKTQRGVPEASRTVMEAELSSTARQLLLM